VISILAVDFVLAFRSSKNKTSLAPFIFLNLFVGVYEAFQGGLSSLFPNIFSYAWSMLALFPLLWLALIDAADAPKTPRKQSCDESKLGIWGYLICGLLMAGAFGATALFRALQNHERVSRADVALGFVASSGSHAIIFGLLGLTIALFKVACNRWPRLASVEPLAPLIFSCGLAVLGLNGMVLPTISFEGPQAGVFSVVLVTVLTIYFRTVVARLQGMIAPTERESAHPSTPRWLFGLAAVVLLLLAYCIPTYIGPTDWDFMLQKMAVLTLWVAGIAFAGWIRLSITTKLRKLFVLVILIAASSGFLFSESRGSALSWNDALESYAGRDISFKLAQALLSRPANSQADAAYYQFLIQHTNLRQSVGPADLQLASDIKPSPREKPNIFLFVIDSLRQDYVSPYNPSVEFTPAIGKFAQDSIVMRNAFTRYGGTAISEPAIWSGVMLPHKQFVQPFYPMNNLQRLLDAEGYQSYISVDPILQQILQLSPAITPLDEDAARSDDSHDAMNAAIVGPVSSRQSPQNSKFWSNLDFVETLQDLESKIDAREDKRKPIFAYTQPQNVHTLTVEQSHAHASRREAIIAELGRIDTAFGAFLRFLQSRGLYNDSIIILTADHGESYGEFGRFGHADFLFPPVIRIPLIVHLPSHMQQTLAWDCHSIAFSIDITPSLYYLLGHGATLNSDLAGRPLFTQKLEEQHTYLRPQYLLASSYAPVYAILGHNGETLFIVDAVNRKSYFYNLSNDPDGVHNLVTPAIREANQPFIREQILMVDKAYGITVK
jgi:uncharacterized protein YfiM (DUF2279 family)